MTEAIVFWTAGIFCVLGALLTITRKSPVASVMWLVMTFVGLAAVFVGMEAYFVAAVQVLVYAGAILVLFLFVIMLLDLRKEEGPRLPGTTIRATGVFFAVALLVGVVWVVVAATTAYNAVHAPIVLNPDEAQVRSIAAVLFTKYLLPFEVTSALLLAAIVGSVVVTRTGKTA